MISPLFVVVVVFRYAANPPELVSAALKRLDYDGKQVVRLTAKAGCKLPETIFEGKPVTVRDLFSHFLDIQSPPRKDALLALSQCATEEKEGRLWSRRPRHRKSMGNASRFYLAK